MRLIEPADRVAHEGLAGDLDVWWMTSGEAGHRSQARGLALALSGAARELCVDLGRPWRWLPAHHVPQASLAPKLEGLGPPWPDLLITCGRRTAAFSLAIRRASGGRTRTVHVQNPLTDPSAFDLVVALRHDRMGGHNVFSVPTALHDVTQAGLAAAARAQRERLAPDGRPLIGVLLGGSLRRRRFGLDEADELLQRLARLRVTTGARLAVTTSRRTPQVVRAKFREALGGDPDAFLWDGAGENPYLAILGLSDRLVVTCDSVSMISEALATSAKVEIHGEADGRHGAFLAEIFARDWARRFDGVAPSPTTQRRPFNSTALAASAVMRMMEQSRRLSTPRRSGR